MANYRLRIGHSVGYQLPADFGNYALSGQAAGLTYSPAASSDPFTWFPALDKADIQFHAGAGEWGVQSTIKESAAPALTSTGTAGTPTQLRDALFTEGVSVALSDDISGLVASGSPILNNEIILPTGSKLISPTFGAFDRLRIRGDNLGTYGGGQIHNLRMDLASFADLVIDGIDSSGTFDLACMALGPGAGSLRAAIVNCRISASGFAIGSTCGDIVIAGCSIITGMDTAAQNSPTNEEAYGFRAYFETNGNIIFYRNDVRSNPARSVSSHARMRCHPDAGIEYIWVDSNRFIDRVEHHIFNVNASDGGGSGSSIATWFTHNEIISDGTGTAPSADTPKLFGSSQSRAYIQHNVFKSSGFTNNGTITLSGSVATTKDNNTFESLPVTDPAWSAAIANGAIPGTGDPSSINRAP